MDAYTNNAAQLQKDVAELKEHSVPYIVYESAMARLERIIKRLWITVLVLIILLAGSNGAWIWYEAQFTDEVTSVSQEAYTDGDGAVLVNNGGDLTYGK